MIHRRHDVVALYVSPDGPYPWLVAEYFDESPEPPGFQITCKRKGYVLVHNGEECVVFRHSYEAAERADEISGGER